MTIRFSGQAGTTMTIYCTAFGPTTSNFTWTKDHVTLQPSYRVKYDVNSTCSALTVRMTKKADSGNYTCKVRCTSVCYWLFFIYLFFHFSGFLNGPTWNYIYMSSQSPVNTASAKVYNKPVRTRNRNVGLEVSVEKCVTGTSRKRGKRCNRESVTGSKRGENMWCWQVRENV